MKSISAPTLLFLCNIISTVLCSTISVSFRHVYSCADHSLHSQTMASCTYDRDCVENAYCWNRTTCYCMDGYLVNKNQSILQCLRMATEMGDPCTADVQCRVTFTAQAECRDNVCACSEDSHYEPETRRCYESVAIGQLCQTSYNCYIEGSQSFCVDGFCSCPLQHHPSADSTKCLKSAFLGNECSIDAECVDLHSRCLGICTCKVDYVLSSDGKRCLKAASSMGDLCIEDSQCKAFLRNAKCGDENKCTCLMNLKQLGSVCYRKINPRMLGEKCTSRTQCVQQTVPETTLSATEVTSVDCINGVCACAHDYTLTERGDDCIRFSENGISRPKDQWTLLFILFVELTYLFN